MTFVYIVLLVNNLVLYCDIDRRYEYNTVIDYNIENRVCVVHEVDELVYYDMAATTIKNRN